MDTNKTIFIIVLLVLLVVLVNVWATKRDKSIATSSEKYQKCVMNTFGVNPSEFYAQNSYYPECNK